MDPQPMNGTLGKKIWCTYWMATGNCNYTQEGCKFKHEMPKDPEVLRALGFREIPAWYRQEMAALNKPRAAMNNKSWRNQGGKPEVPSAPGPSNRTAASPATMHGNPKTVPRHNGHSSASHSPHGSATIHGPPKAIPRNNTHASASVMPQRAATMHGTPKAMPHNTTHISASVSPHGTASMHGTPKAMPHDNPHISAGMMPQGPAAVHGTPKAIPRNTTQISASMMPQGLVTMNGTPNAIPRAHSHISASISPYGTVAMHGTPNAISRANSHNSASHSPYGTATMPQGPSASTQYESNTLAFAAPHQHFPVHVNDMASQRPFIQGGQSSNGSSPAENFQHRQVPHLTPPPYYTSASDVVHRAHSDNSTPPKQPPISRPTSLGQTSSIQPQSNTEASTRTYAPDHRVVNKDSGISISSKYVSDGNPVQDLTLQPYGGMQPSASKSQMTVPALMDINFIAPSSESTRSGSHTIYTPSSANTTPTHNIGTSFDKSNGNVISDPSAGTPSDYNGKTLANHANVPAKGRGSVEFSFNSSPAPTSHTAPQAPTSVASVGESTTTSLTSPTYYHRTMFREPGQPEYVCNPPEPKSSNQNGKAATHNGSPKRHGRKGRAANAAANSAKGKMSGNGYDVPIDMGNSLI